MPKIDGAEVARHNTKKSCWLVLDSRVYDVTSFQSEHPGGTVILLKNAGTVIFSHSLCLWPNLLANKTPGRNHRIQKIPPLDICEATPSQKRPRPHRPKHPRQTQQTKRNNKFSRKWGRCWKQDPSCLSVSLVPISRKWRNQYCLTNPTYMLPHQQTMDFHSKGISRISVVLHSAPEYCVMWAM